MDVLVIYGFGSVKCLNVALRLLLIAMEYVHAISFFVLVTMHMEYLRNGLLLNSNSNLVAAEASLE